MENNTFFESVMEGLKEAIDDAKSDGKSLKKETVDNSPQ